MGEFRFFTLGVGITVIVLGAAAGSAIGLLSGGPASPAPAKTVMSSKTDPATPAATKAAGIGWYLNLHLGNSGDILAKGMPALDFRPELCSDVTTVATSHG